MRYLKLLISLLLSVQLFPCSIVTVEGSSSFLMAGNEDYYEYESSIKFIPGNSDQYGYAVMGVTSYIENYPQIAINEMGLAVDWATVPTGQYKADKSKKNLDSPLIHELMKKCKDLNEVVKFVEGHNVSHFAQEHLMVADSKGNAAVLEWDGKKVQVINRKGNYQLLTNFNLIEGDPFECDRYMNGGSLLNMYDNPEDGIVEALDIMHQDGQFPTLYSYIFDLNSKTITLYNFHDYSKRHVMVLEDELKKEGYIVEISSLEYN